MDTDQGEGMLARKRLHNLRMDATVFQPASNLQPPLEPPPPPTGPVQPPTGLIQGQSLRPRDEYTKRDDTVRDKPAVPEIRLNFGAQKNRHTDCEPETQI